MAELYNLYEETIPRENARLDEQLRQVSTRIEQSSYHTLAKLSERWGVSKSALVAQILEAGLQEFENQLLKDAQSVAL
jgi:predicted DNA-binding protein